MNKKQLIIREILSEQLIISIDSIFDDSFLVDDLGADSLDLIEIILALEEEFSIKISDKKYFEIKTVNDLYILFS